MQKTDFMSLSFFAEKVILELKCTKIPSLELLRTPILCFKSKAQVHEKMFLSNEMNSFLQCRRQIFMCLSFFAEKVILELKCTKSLL